MRSDTSLDSSRVFTQGYGGSFENWFCLIPLISGQREEEIFFSSQPNTASAPSSASWILAPSPATSANQRHVCSKCYGHRRPKLWRWDVLPWRHSPQRRTQGFIFWNLSKKECICEILSRKGLENRGGTGGPGRGHGPLTRWEFSNVCVHSEAQNSRSSLLYFAPSTIIPN
jgi:hypothetical protein